MRAAICREYGPAEVLEIRDMKKPVPGDGQLLIRIHASTVSSGDARVRGLQAPGAMKVLMRLILGFRRPRNPVLGTELAGVIEAVGKQVTRYQEGDPVIALTGMRFGAHAEYICVPEKGLVAPKPANLSFEQSSALLFGGHSALHFFRKAGLKEGQKVLIYGASGSVGTSAVQLARYFGAHVTGVCSTANVDLVKSLGASTIIDYTKESLTSRGESYDIVFDAVGKLPSTVCSALLAPGGRWVSVARGYAKERIEDLFLLKELAEQGLYSPVIDRVYTFEQIQDAHRHVDQGHKKGNVVVKIR